MLLFGLPGVAESRFGWLSCILFFLFFGSTNCNYCIIPIGFAKHAIFFGRYDAIAALLDCSLKPQCHKIHRECYGGPQLSRQITKHTANYKAPRQITKTPRQITKTPRQITKTHGKLQNSTANYKAPRQITKTPRQITKTPRQITKTPRQIAKLHGKLQKLHGKLQKLHGKLQKLHSKLQKLRGKLQKLHGKLQKLHSCPICESRLYTPPPAAQTAKINWESGNEMYCSSIPGFPDVPS